MASVNGKQSRAQRLLGIALGKHQVCFGDLTEEEGNKLLRDTLHEVDLRELRGFKPLRDLLVYHDSHMPMGPRNLLLGENVKLIASEFPVDFPVDMETQMISLSRDRLVVEVVYKRYESDEETNDWEVAHEWERTGYLHHGVGAMLLLRRPRGYAYAEDHLVLVKYWYTKVPQKDCHHINNIEVVPLPIEDFHKHFDKYRAQMAVELIWVLRSAYSRTVDALQSQANAMRQRFNELDRLSDALTYPRPTK